MSQSIVKWIGRKSLLSGHTLNTSVDFLNFETVTQLYKNLRHLEACNDIIMEEEVGHRSRPSFVFKTMITLLLPKKQ